MPTNPKQKILSTLARRRSATGPELAHALGVSRQAVNPHLRALIEAGDVVRTGVTRAARYMLTGRAPQAAALSRNLDLAGLDEGAAWDELAVRLNLHASLRTNVEVIAHYAFTEMLNNAIEHSEASHCHVSLRLEPGRLAFEIRDTGIGVFHSIASKLHFKDEEAAMVELMKGRTTTLREAHTGEGLFFTSRVADRFVLRSHRIRVEWLRSRDDVFVASGRFLKGTEVRFEVQRSARQKLEEVFHEYAPETYDFEFARTKVLVRLLQKDYVSRSEARRLLANLEKFREVTLNFKGVESVGQGFMDEIFRVFAGRHPAIRIEVDNASPAVDAMIRHARSGT
jgi:anti-sigma regulatory factor (Ser/Thr protein kinase)